MGTGCHRKILIFSLFLAALLLPLTGQTGLVPITLRHFPLDSRVFLDGLPVSPDETEEEGEYRTYYMSEGLHHLSVTAEGYLSQTYPIRARGAGELIEGKLEKPGLPLYYLDELPTARQPKSVTFSPDGRYMAVASLGSGKGLQIFSTRPFAHLTDLIPPEPMASQTGFVESCWLPARGEIWFSQMNTGQFHVFSVDGWAYLGSFDAGGAWSKVLLASRDEARVYISNWESETVTEIDTETRAILRTFPVSGIPRGLSLSPEGNSLIVSVFSANSLDFIDLETGESSTRTYSAHSGAMRHLIPDGKRGLLYATNMLLGLVYSLSDRTGAVKRIYRVGQKPNTAQMSPDGRYLFVSCRGPNNPITYLIEGHEFGKIYIIDLEKQAVLGWIWGRDQPTGLDVSPDSGYLAFTDFKDDSLELYRIEREGETGWKELIR